MQWNYTGTFLDIFADRGFITQLIVRAYRGLPTCYYNAPSHDKRPAQNVTEMLSRLKRDITERLEMQHESHKPDLRMLLDVLDGEGVIEFCRFIAKRERLPEIDKQSLKAQEAEKYKNAVLATRPPTVKQLQYLRSLGCEVVPSNQHEASVLITRFRSD